MKQTFSKFDVTALTGLAIGLREFVPYAIETNEVWTKYSSSQHRVPADDIGMYGYDIESAVFRGACKLWLPRKPYLAMRWVKWPNGPRIALPRMMHGQRVPKSVQLFAHYERSAADYLPNTDSAHLHRFTLWWAVTGESNRVDFGYIPESGTVYRSEVARHKIPEVIESWLAAA